MLTFYTLPQAGFRGKWSGDQFFPPNLLSDTPIGPEQWLSR